MATMWEMVNCGKCRKCLAGAKVHGPKQYHYAWNGGRREHRYGPGGGSSGGPEPVFVGELEELPDEEKTRMREEAEAEYRDIVRNQTPEEAAKLEEVLRAQKAYDRVVKAERREEKRRVREAEEESGEAGLTAQALSKIAAEVADQFAAEKKELKKQFAAEKKEWKKMLAANRPRQKSPQG